MNALIARWTSPGLSPWILGGLAGLAWWLSFPPNDLLPLIWVALIPLLWVVDHARRPLPVIFGAACLAFGLSTWWVYRAALIGAVAGVVANAVYLTLAVMFYAWLKKAGTLSEGKRIWLQWLAWVSPWLAMEYVHQRIDLDFPWMLLGHAPANHPMWIQYYEWTGVAGGSLWILSVNFWLYQTLMQRRQARLWAGLWLVIPALLSYSLYQTRKDRGPSIQVLAVQPNLDPYKVKFEPSTYADQMRIFLACTDSLQGKGLVVWPETALPDYWVIGDGAPRNPWLDTLQKYVMKRPGLALMTGASVVQLHGQGRGSPAYTFYNSALGLGSVGPGSMDSGGAQYVSQPLAFYHKSKLVIGVEKLPYPMFFNAIARWISVDLGGMTGQLGTQAERTPLMMGWISKHSVAQGHPDRIPLKVAPMICYESIFGAYCGGFVNEGANLLAVMTNDGWWGETDGHRQHLAYARLRCIEQRRSMIRSANTGISALINQRGELLDTLGWGQRGVVQGFLRLNQEQTLYAKHGDVLGRLACVLTVLFGLLYGARSLMKNRS
ncbi:MAG: apolipoprotein N-acyltransferase [Cytophagia bacterium]|nr:apolipoprotein N-acyltransferase [Cytophagia bacterium]